MPKKSAGLLMYRRRGDVLEVFLVHFGGPYWAKKDEGSWTIPKGEFTQEDGLQAAIREFIEETGFAPEGQFRELPPVVQTNAKVVYAWAFEGDCDAARLRSNTFALEWPPGSGMVQRFPEVDRGAWFTLAEARQKILRGQLPLLEQVEALVRAETSEGR
jgi:predicted NUDIX family NTP pyrophosphohydrolase